MNIIFKLDRRGGCVPHFSKDVDLPGRLCSVAVSVTTRNIHQWKSESFDTLYRQIFVPSYFYPVLNFAPVYFCPFYPRCWRANLNWWHTHAIKKIKIQSDLIFSQQVLGKMKKIWIAINRCLLRCKNQNCNEKYMNNSPYYFS